MVSDGIANPMPSLPAACDTCRVHADHLAIHVHQRATGVTRINGRIGLDEVLELSCADSALTLQRTVFRKR